MPKVVPSQVVEYIEKTFPIVTDKGRYTKVQVTPPVLSAIRTVIELTESIPNELIAIEGPDFIDFISGLMSLKGTIFQWESTGEHRGFNLPFVEGGDQTTGLDIIRDVLKKCPDAAPAPGTAELGFIRDEALRADLRLDWSSANKALADGEWKAATVLSGSIVEALLLWALSNWSADKRMAAISRLKAKAGGFSDPDPNELESRGWGLHEYTEVAAELQIISPQTASEVRQVRGFRNLIHPGVAMRTGQSCSRGTALAALAAAEFVATDVANKSVRSPN